jgi:glucose/arabinose dehydrogenase
MTTRLLCLLALLPVWGAAQTAASRPFRLEELRTPPGFEVSVWARVGGTPRLMTIGPNGVLYVAARSSGQILAIPERDRAIAVARGLNGPHSLEFRDGYLYVAQNDGVVRLANAVTPDYVIPGTPERVLSFPAGGQHSTRTLAIGPDGSLYLANGSTCNFCNESDSRRAAVTRYLPNGSGETIFARGLRNTVGFAFHPVTGELWGADHGGDNLGDNEPPEEVNIIREGGDYGWPDCIGNQRGVNWGPSARPGRCAQTVAPEFEYQAHSAPLGFAFYTGEQFPASFKNDVLIGLHGSWNRSVPYGYKVVRVRTATGRATGMEDFLWGFFDAATRTRSGRPVHAVTAADGSVFVSDDATGNIYKVEYKGPRISPGGIVEAGEFEGRRYFELYGANFEDARVFADGVELEIVYRSARQVNFAAPLTLRGKVTIRVQTPKAADEAAIEIN